MSDDFDPRISAAHGALRAPDGMGMAAQTFATIYVGDQLARIADILEHAHGTPPKWLKPTFAEPTAAEMRDHLADIDRRSRAGHDAQS
jgi:hypothetical protein